MDMLLNSICPLELELQFVQSGHFALGNIVKIGIAFIYLSHIHIVINKININLHCSSSYLLNFRGMKVGLPV